MRPPVLPTLSGLSTGAAVLAFVALAGCGPQLDPNPQPLDFQRVYVGTSKGLTGVWQNSGNAAATISASPLTIGGANAAQFAGMIPGAVPITIRQGQALAPAAVIGFAPNGVGAFTATATPTVAEANARVTAMTLQGEGIAQLGRGSLTVGGQPITIGQPVNFGRVAVGQQSPIITFELQNRFLSTGNVTITRFEFQVNNQGFILVAPLPPFVIPQNGRVNVQMRFRPPQWNQPPREKKFNDGITFFEVRTDTLGNITAGAAGVALCGVGYHPPDPPEMPVMTCP